MVAPIGATGGALPVLVALVLGERPGTLNPVITVGLAVVLLGGRLARRQQLGVAAALAGVLLLAAR